MSGFRLQMVAVTAKNTSFDEDLTIVVVKQVLVYNFKKIFRYVAGVESSSFYGCKVSKCSSCTTGADLDKFLTVLLTTERRRRKNVGGSGGMPPGIFFFQFLLPKVPYPGFWSQSDNIFASCILLGWSLANLRIISSKSMSML